MSGALAVGDVYVVVTASIGQFAKSMKQVADDVAKTAKKVEQFGNKIGEIGSRIAIGLGAALLASSQFEGEVSDQLGRIRAVMTNLGASIGDALAPMLRELGDRLSSLLGWFQRLSPSTKETIAQFLFWGTVVGAAGMVLGKLAGSVAVVAEVISTLLIPAGTGMLSVFGLATAPVWAIVAGVAAIVLVSGALYKAWNTTGNAFGATLRRMWDAVKGWGSKVAEGFKTVFRKVLDVMAATVRGVAKLLAFMGVESAKGFEFLTGDKLLEGMGGALGDVWDGFKDGADFAFDGIKMMGADVADFLKGQFAGIFDGAGGTLRDPNVAGTAKRPSVAGSAIAAGQVGAAANFVSLADLPGVGKRLTAHFESEVQKSIKAAALALQSRMKNLVVGKIVRALGTLGELIENAVAGFQAGGPMGAVVAVVTDLLTHSESFRRIVAMLNGFLQMLSDTVGQVLAPIIPTVAAVLNVLAELLKALAPALNLLAAPLAAVTPIIQTLATIFQGLGPIISGLAQMLVAIMQPLTVLAGPVMKGFFAVVKYLGLGILYVVKGIGTVWNALVSAVQWVFKQLGKIPLVGGFFDGLAKDMEKWKLPMSEVNSAINTLANSSYDSAAASAAATAAQWEQYGATKAATEALTNVPSGYKLALARFNASEGTTPGAGVPGISAPPAAPVTNNTTSNITINVTGKDADDTAKKVLIELRTESRRRRGTDSTGYGYEP